MQNMDLYYDFSGQKFGYPLSMSINGFSRNIFSRQSSLEISYVLKGSYEAVTPHFSCTLKEQDMIVIAPDDIHMLHKKSPNNPSIILTVHIDFDRMSDSMVGDIHTGFVTAVCTKTRNKESYFQLQKKLGQLVSQLTTNCINLYRMNVIMMELVCIAASPTSFSVDELPLHTEYHENYMKAIQYIDHHFKEKLTLNEIARQLSFSPSYTSKLLKRFTGIPFVKYLAYVRVRASLEVLLEGRECIQKIALDYGLPSAKAYTEVFRELYGILPSAYRKQFRNNMKYSQDSPCQKMVLQQEQNALLQHLIDRSVEPLLEDDHISVRCKEDQLIVTIPHGPIEINAEKDGGMILKIPKGR